MKVLKKNVYIILILILLYFIWTLISLCSFNLSMFGHQSVIGSSQWYNYSDDGLNGPSIAYDDPRLLAKMKKYLIPPPSFANHEYHLSEPQIEDTSMGQAQIVRKYLKNKRNGVFIECGALDGEVRSNTLYFERYLNWTGLLIEADPLNVEELVKKNRRAWLSPTCLSLKPHPEMVLFQQNKNLGKISDDAVDAKKPNHVPVQCFPMYSYILALNMTKIDYLSLDIEGHELQVLKTLPFNLVDIKVLSVEFAHVPDGKQALLMFMLSKGYSLLDEVTHPNWLANDFIFIKR